MIGLCTGSGWRKDLLHIEVRGESKLLPLCVGDTLSWKITKPRHCIGYRPPEGDASLHACPEEVAGISASQCDLCFERAAILPCLRCDGERCRNPERRSSCVQPENHALYLASFGPGIIKVGVARWGRRRERIIEQGARAALVVGRDDGQLVRRSEQSIRKLGIPDRIPPSAKVTALPLEVDQNALLGELDTAFRDIRQRARARWLEEAEVIDLPLFLPPSYRPDLQRPGQGWSVRGEIEGILGSFVVVRRDGGDLIVFEVSGLHGFILEELGEEEASSGQTSLALSA